VCVPCLPRVILVGLLLAKEAQAAMVVEAPESGCPGRGAVVSALEARLPGVTRPGADGGRRLELAPGNDGVALRLRDASGALVLERQLELDGRTAASSKRGEGCQALAEAAALVVVRYLREIGYRSPAAGVVESAVESVESAVEPSSTAARPVVVNGWPSTGLLGVAGAARVGAGSSSGSPRGELMLTLGAYGRRLAAELAGGASSLAVIPVPGSTGELRLRAFPVRASLGVAVPVPGGMMVAAAGVNLDVLFFQASGLEDARRGTRVDPALELATSYIVRRGRLFVRARVAAGRALSPWDFDARRPVPVFRTADAYFRGQIEVGVVMWKNEPEVSL
jgi:hypothetical protein